MNFKEMLETLSQLSEATKETGRGRVHTAEPGGYGRKFDTDEEGDEKKDKAPAVKRGRGRPKKGADDSGEVKKYDNAKALQSFMIGNVPKKSKELEKLPKKKHSLKEYFDKIDEASQMPIPVVGKEGDTQQTGAGFLHIDDSSPAGQAMKDAIGKLAQQKKAQIVVPTPKQPTQPAQTAKQPAPAGATGQAPAGQAQVSEKWGTDTKVSPEEKGKYAGKSKSELLKAYHALKKSGPHKKGSDEFGRMRELAFAIRAKGDWGKVKEADQPPNDSLSSPLTMEAKAKPDYIDLDKDRNKKESMKKAASDAKQDKKKVNESMHKHTSARLLGKAHALAKEGYNCKYEDMEEAKCYHEGYKEGLDECYGKGVYEAAPATPPATVGGMAQQADDIEEGMLDKIKGAFKRPEPAPAAVARPASTGPRLSAAQQQAKDDGDFFDYTDAIRGGNPAARAALNKEVEEGNFFTGNLEKAREAGKSHADLDGDGDLEKVSEFAMAFENWDNQLNQLLTENEKVEEGMTVSISKGQQGMPDSVSVSAQDQEADALLGLIKQAGLGLFGGEDKPNLGLMPAHDHEPAEIGAQGDNIDVVGDHDGMMALIKKVTGGHDSDYADEEGDHGHDHEEPCEACGESSCKCDEETEMVEDETLNQREEEVAEDLTTDPQADEEAEAEEDKALATVDAAQDAADKEEQVTEWANDAGQDTSDEQTMMDPDFMMNTITSGLNKKKRDVGGNGQSTVPVTVVRTNESVDDWMRLAGIK